MSDVQRQDCGGKKELMAWRVEVGALSSLERAVRLETDRRRIVVPNTQTGAWVGCGAFEWIALGYLTLSCVLIATFWKNLAHPTKLICGQCLWGARIFS